MKVNFFILIIFPLFVFAENSDQFPSKTSSVSEICANHSSALVFGYEDSSPNNQYSIYNKTCLNNYSENSYNPFALEACRKSILFVEKITPQDRTPPGTTAKSKCLDLIKDKIFDNTKVSHCYKLAYEGSTETALGCLKEVLYPRKVSNTIPNLKPDEKPRGLGLGRGGQY